MQRQLFSYSSIKYRFLASYGKSLLLAVILLLGCAPSEPPPPAQSHITENVVDSSTIKQEESSTIVRSIDYDSTLWTEILIQDSILLDLRYASTNNFVDEQLYDCSRCFLRPEVAKALLKAQSALVEKGLRLKLFDCYRPRQVQERLWEKVPDASYVTPPKKGSMHNRGAAVDLTVVNEDGEELDMGTEFDFFGVTAHHTHQNLPANVLQNRQMLKTVMAEHGFSAIRTEWWHYSYRSKTFPLDTMQWSCE